MVKYLAFLIFFVGALIFSVGQWVAFEIYANAKLSKVNQNIASLLAGMPAGEGFINIPNAEENFFSIRTKEGKVISTNRTPPIGLEHYVSVNLSAGGSQVQVYTKKVGLIEYLNLLLERPFALGVSISGIILLLLSLVLLLKGQQVAPIKQETDLQKDILNRLKALRTALAFSGVIPRESIEEAKGIIDNIIKRMEVKR